ncbi:WD-40 repeat-containing protein [Tolypothrix tenuis PCC 7101]|uniref:WD-40 repeat-containing protein n=1 Tax=Tolypothrix tenuis PCC 7101 TaxID=231146 RepID=A0A1Z4MZ08_9CYAN|nr:WD-40 repeat-containing protein [Tolypothrix tenuis PCC 7101]
MTHEEAENLGADNESSLQTLVRAIRLSQGEFSLILLRCNYGALRQQMVQRIHELSTVEIKEITLPASVKTLYSAIKAELGDEQPPALMIFGLELVKDIDTVLTAANQVREEFRKNFPFPILLWINDQVLQKMIRLAADLDNWATTINFNNSTHNLIEFLQRKTDEIFAGDVKPSSQICGELTTARQDLQSRGQVLDAAIIASLEFVLGYDDYLHDRIDEALSHYQESLGFWRGSNNLERYGILLAHIALAYQRLANIQQVDNQGYWQEARNYLQQAIVIFEQAQKPDLIAEYISKLGEVLRSLQAWSDLQGLAEQALILHENNGTPLQIAQDYGFLAEVALQKSRWDEAQHFAQQALDVLASLAEILNVMARNGEQFPAFVNITLANSKVLFAGDGEREKVKGEGENTKPFPLYPSPFPEFGNNSNVVNINLAKALFAGDGEREKVKGEGENTKPFPLTPSPFAEFYKEAGLYRFILAGSQQGLGDIAGAIDSLELAKTETQPQYNPQLYISILEKLRLLYFEQARYLDAFHLKQERLQIEQQYGFRAFVGASYLNPQRQAINPAQIPAENTETIAQEIAVSSRVQDVRRLRERVSRNEYKLTVIHGQSGVGKSSILQGGLIPALQEKPIGERDALPILLRSYTDWVGMLGRSLVESIERLGGISLNSAAEILAQLRHNEGRNLLTVLIFDQFEEFFFVYQDQGKRRPFYDFLRDCLNIPFVKVILSLREDYLHYLLELDRLFDLTVINNNILDKNIRYYLGNFSSDDAKTVIQSLTERTHFYLEPNLIDQLVKDLAGEIGEVRPIELQIVGAQLQTEKITSLERYRQAGTKEKLVERFLEEVIKDCGAVNESVARLVLYLLTDENGTRPLKTKDELAANLPASDEELDLVLEIFVKSGLVLLVQESPAERYQLVHDYLVDLIRQMQGNDLLEELAKEREQRLQAEENLQREQAAKKILADANREAEQKIKQGRNRLALSSGLAIVLLLAASLSALYAINKISEANIANKEKQDSVAQMLAAKTDLKQVDRQKRQAENQLRENQKKAQDLENKQKDLQKNYQEALKTKQAAADESKLAKQETQQAKQNLLKAQADLDKVNQEAATLQERNAQAEERIKKANRNVKAAEEKVRLADIRQKEAELKARQADDTLKQAQASLTQAQSAKIAAEAAQKEALQGTNLERAGANALRQFEYAALESLVSAMHSGKELKNIVKDNRPLEKYPAFSPIYALHSILSNIKERNQFQGHQDSVLSVSFSPDGKTIATASSDKTARLWNLQGQLLQEFIGHQDSVWGVSFSPDGKTIATASWDAVS